MKDRVIMLCWLWYAIALTVSGCIIPNPWPKPIPVPPGPTPAPVVCGCSDQKVDYTGTKESDGGIATIGPSSDFRCLINDEHADGSWVTKYAVKGHVKFADTTMTVECFELETGIRAHYLGWRQPSSSSTMKTNNPATVTGNGTLRAYFSSRKPK